MGSSPLHYSSLALLLLIMGAVFEGIGLILLVVGMATPCWMEGSGLAIVRGGGGGGGGGGLATPPAMQVEVDLNLGLWTMCSGPECVALEDVLEYWNEHSTDYKAVRAMILLGMLVGFGGVAMGSTVVFMASLGKVIRNVLSISCLVSALTAGVMVMTGIIVYAVQIYEDVPTSQTTAAAAAAADLDLGYSMALCIVGGVALLPLGGVLAFVPLTSSSASWNASQAVTPAAGHSVATP